MRHWTLVRYVCKWWRFTVKIDGSHWGITRCILYCATMSFHKYNRVVVSSLAIFAWILTASTFLEKDLFFCSVSVHLFVFLPPATKFGEGYVFTRVYDSVHRGVSATMPPWEDSTPRQIPPWTDIPQGDTPRETHPLCSACWDTVNKRPVRILLECNLVLIIFFKSFARRWSELIFNVTYLWLNNISLVMLYSHCTGMWPGTGKGLRMGSIYIISKCSH